MSKIIYNFVIIKQLSVMSRIPFALIYVLFIGLLSCKNERKLEDTTINIRLKKDPERINPLLFPNPTAREVYQYLHLPLADFDPTTLELSPILIKSIPKPIAIDTGMYKGGLSINIEILDGAKWDNGSPITAEDYVFTIKAINLPLTNAAKYRDLTQNITDIAIDKSNPKKFSVIFAKDYMLALETAVNVEIYPKYYYDPNNALNAYKVTDFVEENKTKLEADSTLSKFAAAFNGNDFSRDKLSGSGPYAIESWVADQSVILVKKENYWAQDLDVPLLAQGPDKMVFHIIPDELSAVTQLKAGTIDLINEISAENYQELSKDPSLIDKFSFYHPSLMKHYLINMNNGNPKLADKNVRKAITHLVEVDNVIANIEKGMAVRVVGPIHPVKKTHNKSLTPIPFDIDAAEKLLTEAGWKDTNGNGTIDKKIESKTTELELEILISGQELGKQLALILQQNAAKVGIKINITQKEFKQIRAENLKTRNYDLVPTVISQDVQAWDDLKNDWHSSNDTPDGSNYTSYRNAEVDALLDKILATKDNGERIKLYQDIQEKIYNDQPAIFLYAPEEKIVVSKKWNSSSTVKRPGYMANTFQLSKNTVSSQN